MSPEPISETVAQPSATYMSLEPAEPMPAAPEPASEAEPSPPSEAVLFAPAAEPPALPTPEPIRAAEAQTVAATALPQPIDLPEPETVPAAAVARPVSQAFPTVRPESPEPRSARAKTMVAEPAPPIRPRARERVPFAGIWAASPEACTPAMQEEGHLLARIGARGGRAGDTSCRFKTIRREGTPGNQCRLLGRENPLEVGCAAVADARPPDLDEPEGLEDLRALSARVESHRDANPSQNLPNREITSNVSCHPPIKRRDAARASD